MFKEVFLVKFKRELSEVYNEKTELIINEAKDYIHEKMNEGQLEKDIVAEIGDINALAHNCLSEEISINDRDNELLMRIRKLFGLDEIVDSSDFAAAELNDINIKKYDEEVQREVEKIITVNDRDDELTYLESKRSMSLLTIIFLILGFSIFLILTILLFIGLLGFIYVAYKGTPYVGFSTMLFGATGISYLIMFSFGKRLFKRAPVDIELFITTLVISSILIFIGMWTCAEEIKELNHNDSFQEKTNFNRSEYILTYDFNNNNLEIKLDSDIKYEIIIDNDQIDSVRVEVSEYTDFMELSKNSDLTNGTKTITFYANKKYLNIKADIKLYSLVVENLIHKESFNYNIVHNPEMFIYVSEDNLDSLTID